MTATRRIYFDQAATTWPKLPEAVAAAEHFVHECGATSGRGAYSSARTADRWISEARLHLSRLVGASDAGDVALCTSGTHALNAILLGWLRAGDHVITTAIEHNSVLRPLEHLRRTRDVEVSIVPCDEVGLVDIDAARHMFQSNTRAIVISHASNVTGCRQDLALWSELAHDHNTKLIVDASQTVGYLPISVGQLGIDALASAGHKGLGGLAGSGFLVAAPEIQAQLEPLMFGGTGTSSEQLDFIPSWPQSIEVGNLNLPAVVSMAAAAEVWLRDAGDHMFSWQEPLERLVRGLRNSQKADQLRVIGHTTEQEPGAAAAWLPIVSLELKNWDIHEAAAVLDANFGVETRAGYHCAALIHSALGTEAAGGTLRLSLTHHTPLVDVDDVLHGLQAML